MQLYCKNIIRDLALLFDLFIGIYRLKKCVRQKVQPTSAHSTWSINKLFTNDEQKRFF